jgi:hypothetical protein
LRAATIQLKEEANKNKLGMLFRCCVYSDLSFLDLQTQIAENSLESKTKFSEFNLNLNSAKEEILQKSKEKFAEAENALQESQKKNDSKFAEISQKTASLVDEAKEELTKNAKERLSELEGRVVGSVSALTEGMAKRFEKVEGAQTSGEEKWNEQLQKVEKKLQSELADRAEALEKNAKNECEVQERRAKEHAQRCVEVQEKVESVEKKLQAEATERAESLEKRLRADGESLEKKLREHEARAEEIHSKLEKKIATVAQQVEKSVEARFETALEEVRNSENVVRLNVEKRGSELLGQFQKLEVLFNDRLSVVENEAKLGISEGQTAREEVKNSEKVVRLNVEKIGSDLLQQFQTFNALFSERLVKVENDAKTGITESAAAKEEAKNTEKIVLQNVERMGGELLVQFQNFDSSYSGRLEKAENDAKLGISESQAAREEVKNTENVVLQNVEKMGSDLLGQFQKFDSLFSGRMEKAENDAKLSVEESEKRVAELTRQQEMIVQLTNEVMAIEMRLTANLAAHANESKVTQADSATHVSELVAALQQRLDGAKTEWEEKLTRAFEQQSAVSDGQLVSLQEALRGLDQKSNDSLLVMNNCVTELFNAKKQTMEVDEKLEAFKLESTQQRDSAGQVELVRAEELTRVKAEIAAAQEEVKSVRETLTQSLCEESARFEQFKDEANGRREETEKSLTESMNGYNHGIEAALSRLESQWKQSLQEVEAHVKSESERRANEMQLLILQRANPDDAESSTAKIQALTQELGMNSFSLRTVFVVVVVVVVVVVEDICSYLRSASARNREEVG